MYCEKPFLHTPPDDTKLWRYLDLSYFLWLLSRQSLYFADLIEFDDQWEGALPAGSIEGLKRMAASVPLKDLDKLIHNWIGANRDLSIHQRFKNALKYLQAKLRR